MLATEKMSHEECPVLVWYCLFYNFQAEKKARADALVNLRSLEVRLKESPYLAGDELSVADIIIASCIRPLFMYVFGEVERKNSPSMCEWMNKLYTSVFFWTTNWCVDYVCGNCWRNYFVGKLKERKEEELNGNNEWVMLFVE